MFGFSIAEIFLIGGFVITVLYSYFKVNQLPNEWGRWKDGIEKRVENLEQDSKIWASSFSSLQATLKSVEDRIQRVDNHLSVILSHLISKGKGE